MSVGTAAVVAEREPPPPDWWRVGRRWALRFIDMALLAVAFQISYQLRFDFAVAADELRRSWTQLPLVVGLQLCALTVCGVYRLIPRHLGLAEAGIFMKAALLSLPALLLLRFGLPTRLYSLRVPISVAMTTTVLGLGGLVLSRAAWRALCESRELARDRARPRRVSKARTRVIFAGAGQAGLLAARELRRQPNPALEVVGFVDDDRAKVGANVHGIPVLGTSQELEALARQHRATQLVVTIARIDRAGLRRLLLAGEKAGLQVRIMPSLHEILDGRVSVSRFRELRIDDLLGRDSVQIDEQVLSRLLTGRRVLVTGAGGSIGSELARQVARFQPECLLLADRAEPALFAVHQEIAHGYSNVRSVAVLADIADASCMRQLLRAHRPQLILHAAAHKHVPLMEAHPLEAVKNNVLATETLGELAGEAGVESFVLVSTDKAVRPASIMGASKRIAELVIQDLDSRHDTRFLAVRLGNVLGSAGSVVPLFRDQIERGGPVRVTHPDMVRWFMTIPEAAQLILQASTLGEGGEIFLLDMGEPMRIVDLATEMVRLSGLEPGVDIDIVFTGTRPGEKLVEELYHCDEGLLNTGHAKIFVGRLPPRPAKQVQAVLEGLRSAVARGDSNEARRIFIDALPDSQLAPAQTELQREATAAKKLTVPWPV